MGDVAGARAGGWRSGDPSPILHSVRCHATPHQWRSACHRSSEGAAKRQSAWGVFQGHEAFRYLSPLLHGSLSLTVSNLCATCYSVGTVAKEPSGRCDATDASGARTSISGLGSGSQNKKPLSFWGKQDENGAFHAPVRSQYAGGRRKPLAYPLGTSYPQDEAENKEPTCAYGKETVTYDSCWPIAY